MDASKALVFEVQKLSTEDGPGLRTTVFFKECPMTCAWCHNPESFSRHPVIQWFGTRCIGCETCLGACPRSALTFDDAGLVIDRDACDACGDCVSACPSTALTATGRPVSLDELCAEVLKDRAFFEASGGGVTVSGGEPTLQASFVEAFLRRCKENGMATALDTCGLASRVTYERLLPHVDVVLYDIKEIDPARHVSFTGVPNDKILENCRWLAGELARLGKRLWIRTPVVPGYTATAGNIQGIGEFIVHDLGNAIERWDLLAFNNLAGDKYARMDLAWPMKGVPLLSKREMEDLHRVAVATGARNPRWSGMTRREEAGSS